MKLKNTMSGQLETLKPLIEKTVSFYSCGLTVYSQPHIGNWAGYVYWDVLERVLEADGYDVIRTQNITDVGHLVSDDDSGEDKMEKGARREGKTAWDIAEKYISVADYEAYELLDLKKPSHIVRATDLIEKQIAFAEQLEKDGYLYKIPDEGMYFDTSKLDDYGKLAHLDVGGLEAGKRVAMNGKKHISDFAVWKFSPKNEQRDMEWQSPWGIGFPGWHLECSVIARETLGDQIDIHAGGIDHIPVHHTNEIAQTESLTKKPFAALWLHNNHLKVNGTKISKSLGNTFTLQDLLDHGFSMDTFKLLLLSKHYRTEGNFTWEIMDAARNRLLHWRNIAALRWQCHDTIESDEAKSDTHDINSVLKSVVHAAMESLRDDLNTPETLAKIEQAFDHIDSTPIDAINHDTLTQLFEWIDAIFGLHLLETSPDIPDEAKKMILSREQARQIKDWATADQIRDALDDNFTIVLKDSGSRTIWQYR